MKKFLFAGWLALAISVSAAASEDKTTIDPRVLSAFQKEFYFAEM